MLDYGQAQAGSAGCRRTAVIDPIETFSQSWYVYRVYADATVAYDQMVTVILLLPYYGNSDFIWTVFNGIVDEI